MNVFPLKSHAEVSSNRHVRFWETDDQKHAVCFVDLDQHPYRGNSRRKDFALAHGLKNTAHHGSGHLVNRSHCACRQEAERGKCLWPACCLLFVQSMTLDHEMAPPVFSTGLLPRVKFSGSTFRHTGLYLLGDSCSHVGNEEEPSFKAINIFWYFGGSCFHINTSRPIFSDL